MANRISSYFADSHWIFQEYSNATRFMDFGVLATFAVGLALSFGLLYYLASSSSKPAMSKEEWRPFKLIEKMPVSKTTAMYTYPQGNVSRAVNQLKIGDSIEMKGPRGTFEYERNASDVVGLLAGGTGLTPCLQVLEHALRDDLDKTRFAMIYANTEHSEILLKDRLDALAKQHPDRFRVHYFLMDAPDDWQGGKGYVTQDAIDQHLCKSSDRNRLLMCGPPPMINAMKGHLEKLEFPSARTVSQARDPVYVF
ncbi:cytochrome-b5 reductase [Malassezia psittaci]|uniref:Cytochrome-b5 reductase n=1 Tax=Malassezia psittaci TaxID=1821823 RepID=A0AAF0FFS3_9BASI|nr:cytochrome-b5 reductase [Malassezia psittaci]